MNSACQVKSLKIIKLHEFLHLIPLPYTPYIPPKNNNREIKASEQLIVLPKSETKHTQAESTAVVQVLIDKSFLNFCYLTAPLGVTL